ncbi:hypothetical protein MMC16_000081 [Acarospora aff. strigata]|nr:hypothetical protein [Acarospora aff. strigata]
MKISSTLALVFVSTFTVHNNLVGADSLTRLWCQCSGRDIYGFANEYVYHSDRLRKDIHLYNTCRTAPDARGERQHCNTMALRLPKVCKKDKDKTELCYDRNYWGTDTVSLDGKKTTLKHNKGYKKHEVLDCTATCRKYWPEAVRLSSNCNYTSIGTVIPLSKNACEFDTFTDLKRL